MKPRQSASGGWQRDFRHRAAALAGSQRDVAAPLARERPGDREPEAGSRRAAAPGAAAVEALEDLLLLARSQPGSAVTDEHPAARDRDLDLAAVGRVVQRVLHERIEDAVGVGAADPGGRGTVGAGAQRLVALARQWGGDVTLRARDGGGTVAEVTLPPA